MWERNINPWPLVHSVIGDQTHNPGWESNPQAFALQADARPAEPTGQGQLPLCEHWAPLDGVNRGAGVNAGDTGVALRRWPGRSGGLGVRVGNGGRRFAAALDRGGEGTGH